MKPSSVIGFFLDSSALVAATKKVREAGYSSFDAFTPFPVHGLDTAQGLKRSPIPYVTFVFGITGTTLAFLFQYWTSAMDWPINVGGKPLNSWPAFVPIMFEVTILLGGLSTVAALFALCKLPNIKKSLIDPSITRDRFALVIESSCEKSDSEKLKSFLQSIGACEVRSLDLEIGE